MSDLSPTEQEFLYNLDVLGMTQQRAADLAGMGTSPATVLKRPAVLAAREVLRKELQTSVNITREDVIRGIMKAVEKADLIDEPMAMIAGWKEISKIMGYDAPKEINVNISGTVTEVRRQLSQLTDAELLEQLGGEANSILDGDFVRIGHDAHDPA